MDNRFMKDAALWYGNLGFKVVPLWPLGKTPFLGFSKQEPSCDLEIIKRWWTISPNSNIGLPTGKDFNNLIVLDLDIANGINGYECLKEICEAHSIQLPETSVVKSGSGGMHMYFRNTIGIVHGGKNLKPCIDVRAEGAHIVAPPSLHKNGTRYEWYHGDINTIADANEEVKRLLSILKKEGKTYE